MLGACGWLRVSTAFPVKSEFSCFVAVFFRSFSVSFFLSFMYLFIYFLFRLVFVCCFLWTVSVDVKHHVYLLTY